MRKYSQKLRSIFSLTLSALLFLCGCTSAPPSTERVEVSEPKSAGLRISTAGVGAGNYTRVAYWLADSLVKESPDLSVWPEFRGNLVGRGFRDGLLRLADRQTDIALINSHGVAAMALKGAGMFEKPIPLRAVAVIPEDDWCVFVVDAALGVRSFKDLREKKVPLKLATGYLDGDSAIGFLALELLKRHGIDPEEFKSWGGQFMSGGPNASRAEYESGAADAWFQEAAFPEVLAGTLKKRPAAVLSIDPEVARQMEEELGVASITVPPGTYPGQDQPLIALDFSGFIVGVREDATEDLAYRLARIVVEKREELDRLQQFGPIRVVTAFNVVAEPYAIDPANVAKTTVPLHPGAIRYYREKGLMK
jgi:uncharacterized protein